LYHKFNKKRSGFTIVELLVAVAIFCILASLVSVGTVKLKQKALDRAQEQARQQVFLERVGNSGYWPVSGTFREHESISNVLDSFRLFEERHPNLESVQIVYNSGNGRINGFFLRYRPAVTNAPVRLER